MGNVVALGVDDPRARVRRRAARRAQARCRSWSSGPSTVSGTASLCPYIWYSTSPHNARASSSVRSLIGAAAVEDRAQAGEVARAPARGGRRSSGSSSGPAASSCSAPARPARGSASGWNAGMTRRSPPGGERCRTSAAARRVSSGPGGEVAVARAQRAASPAAISVATARQPATVCRMPFGLPVVPAEKRITWGSSSRERDSGIVGRRRRPGRPRSRGVPSGALPPKTITSRSELVPRQHVGDRLVLAGLHDQRRRFDELEQVEVRLGSVLGVEGCAHVAAERDRAHLLDELEAVVAQGRDPLARLDPERSRARSRAGTSARIDPRSSGSSPRS